MITLKQINRPNVRDKREQLIYEFYENDVLIGKATFKPTIYKTKLSLDVYHNDNSPFFKLHGCNWQGAGHTLSTNKTNALNMFETWYNFLNK